MTRPGRDRSQPHSRASAAAHDVVGEEYSGINGTTSRDEVVVVRVEPLRHLQGPTLSSPRASAK